MGLLVAAAGEIRIAAVNTNTPRPPLAGIENQWPDTSTLGGSHHDTPDVCLPSADGTGRGSLAAASVEAAVGAGVGPQARQRA